LIPRPEKKKPEEPTYLRPLSAEEYQAQQQAEEAAEKAEADKKQQAKDDLWAVIKKQEDLMKQEATDGPVVPAPVEPQQVFEGQEVAQDDPRFKEPVYGFGKVRIILVTTFIAFVKIDLLARAPGVY